MQGILAPVQFLIFGVSLYLVVNYLRTGENYDLAVASVVVKTLALYTIMVTGAIWEKVVFGQYLFHDSFFWEDVFSMLVIVLHSLYLLGLFAGIATPTQLMATALAAYFAYVINAAQFVWKLRQARLSSSAAQVQSPDVQVAAAGGDMAAKAAQAPEIAQAAAIAA